MTLHVIKLCVGAVSIEDLSAWQKAHRKGKHKATGKACVFHTTFQTPKRQAELLDGGSLFWVIRGTIRVRHRILRLDDVTDADGQQYCAIIYDPKVTLVEPRPRRAFQGWRYLEAEDAPPDLPNQRQALANAAAEVDMPADMLAELRTLGLF